MPEKPYEALWLFPDKEFIDTVKTSFTRELTANPEYDGVPQEVMHHDVMNSAVTQVYKDTDGSLKARLAFPALFIHEKEGKQFLFLSTEQSYKGGYAIPEGYRQYPPQAVAEIEHSLSSPYSRAPLYHRDGLDTEIPGDFDPAIHIVHPSKLYTLSDAPTEATIAGSEEGHEFDGPLGPAEYEPEGP